MRAVKIINKNYISNYTINKKELLNEFEILQKLVKSKGSSKYYKNIWFLWRSELYLYFHGDNLIRLLEGGNLVDRNIILQRPFNELEVRDIIKQVLAALACCHSHKLSHRDIKLQNIMFKNCSENSTVKLIDFGSAKKIKKNEIQPLMGTIQFLAPEILEKKESNLKSDIYSVGVLLYYLIKGCFPFNANTIEEHTAQVLKHNFGYDKLPELKGFSENGKACLRRMLIIDVNQRPSAEELLKNPWFNTNVPTSQLNEADKTEIFMNLTKYKV